MASGSLIPVASRNRYVVYWFRSSVAVLPARGREMTALELQEALDLSKGAVSMVTRSSNNGASLPACASRRTLPGTSARNRPDR